MKYFLFGIVCVASVLALPPLPPLPPIPGLKSSLAAPTSSKSLDNPSSVADSVAAPKDVNAPRLPPIMIDVKDSGQSPASADDGAEKSKNIDDVLKSVSEIEQQVTAFQGAEQDVDGLYAGIQKKLDEFYMAADGFVGQTGSYAEDLESDLAKKGPEFTAYNAQSISSEIKKKSDDALIAVSGAKTGVEEIKKLLAVAKDGRAAISREEDVVRQKVVDFKKNSGEVSAFYAQAVTLKNGMLISGGDAVAAVSQCSDLSKKAREFVDALKTKDSAEIKDSLKKIEGLIAGADDAKKAIVTKLDALKKIVATIFVAENDLKKAQMAEDLKNVEPVVLSKKTEKSSVSGKVVAVEPEESAGEATSARVNMSSEVFSTIQQGVHLIIDKAQNLLTGALAWGNGLLGRVTIRVVEEKRDGPSVDAVVKKTADADEKKDEAKPSDVPLATISGLPEVKKELAAAPQSLEKTDVVVEAKQPEPSITKLPALPPLPSLTPVPKPA